MDYIINPMFFYWISVSECAKIALGLTIFVMLLVLLFSPLWIESVYMGTTAEGGKDRQIREKLWRYMKVVTITLPFLVIIMILIPSKNTLYQMMAASLVTTDNISITKDSATDLIKFITEQVTAVVQSAK